MRGWKALLFILFFLPSCTNRGPWHFSGVDTTCSLYDSAVLYYVPPSAFNGIEVQFLAGAFGLRTSLGVYCSHIPPGSKAVFVIDGVRYIFEGALMKGGQRLVLPEEAACLMIDAWQRGSTVTVALGGYFSEIPPGNFCELHRELQPYTICRK